MISKTIAQRQEHFKQFHQANPHVYTKLLKFARQIKTNHRIKKWGMRNLWEKLRWDLAVNVDNLDDIYKLNDHLAPFYARLILRDFPEEFDGWLEVRGNNCPLPRDI